MAQIMLRRTSLLVVDMQKGFTSLCSDELPVPGGLEIVPAVNRLLELPWKRIDASLDWHPADHCSFLGRRDNLYPPHCVINTPGAEFIPGLRSERFGALWRKGYEPDREAYAVGDQHPGFDEMLGGEGIGTTVVCGIATNICVFLEAKHLRESGLEVYLVEDASAGIDVPAAGLFQAKARAEGIALGIHYVRLADILKMVE